MVKSSDFHPVCSGSIPGADVFQEFSKSPRFSKFCEKTWNQQLLFYYSINSATLGFYKSGTNNESKLTPKNIPGKGPYIQLRQILCLPSFFEKTGICVFGRMDARKEKGHQYWKVTSKMDNLLKQKSIKNGRLIKGVINESGRQNQTKYRISSNLSRTSNLTPPL